MLAQCRRTARRDGQNDEGHDHAGEHDHEQRGGQDLEARDLHAPRIWRAAQPVGYSAAAAAKPRIAGRP